MASDRPHTQPPRRPASGTTAGTGVLSSTATGVEIGTKIMGTFEIVEHIATGGMGEVYRGINIHTKEPVAIKIVLAALAHDEKILSMFQKEATVLGRLHHDAIVRYQLFTIDPEIRRACLVMEFVEGRALSDFITTGAVPLADVIAMAEHLTAGLQKAHALGVVHRDLSPDNVIVTGGDMGHVKIIDFGIAKSANFGGGTLLEGQFAGKFNYVSPEQLGRFKGEITARSDIYSLALVLAAACLGRPMDMGDTPADAVERRFTVPDLTGVYPELIPILSQMLEPDPANRPTDMAGVQKMFEAVVVVDGPDALRAPRDTVVPPPEMSRPPAFNFTDVAGRRRDGNDATVLSQPPSPQVGHDATVISTPPGAGQPVSAAPHSLPPQSVPPSSMPPGSIPPGGDAGATVISTPPQSFAAGGATHVSQPPVASDNDSPFGTVPTAPPISGPSPEPAQSAPAPAPGKRSPAVLILLAVLAAAVGAGAWFGGTKLGMIGPEQDEVAVSPTPDPAPLADAQPVTAAAPSAPLPVPPVSAPAPTPVDPAPEDPPETTQSAPVAPAQPAAPDPVTAIADEVVEMAGQAAALQPAPTPQPAAAPASEPLPVQELTPDQAWLAGFQLPSCTLARPASEVGGTFGIETFGTAVEPIIALDTAYKAERGREADIGFRQISERQCAVVDFLSRARIFGDDAPDLFLDSDVLRPGGAVPLRGGVADLGGRSVWLLLVDDQGGAYDISTLLKSAEGGDKRFTLAVNATARPDAPELRPQLLIAVTSDAPIESINFSPGDQIKDVLDQAEAFLSAQGEEVLADVAYFKLEDS